MTTAPTAPAPAPFTFQVNTPHPYISTQRILDSLKAFDAQRANLPFSTNQYDLWPGRVASTATISKRFGSWWKAIEAAGLKPRRRYKWTSEDLMTTLEQAWRTLGERPGIDELKDIANVSQQPYVSRWGSLKRACELLAQYKNGEITREHLLNPPTKPRKRRSPLSPSLRYDVMKRDNHQCTLCGRKAGGVPRVTLEVDHITPVAKGGQNALKNLRTLCMDCNRGKSDKD